MLKKRATQDDVATLAGVTRATVSYVLTGRAEALKITPEVIRRVEKAAKKLHYLPNLAARSLAAGQSRQIGLIIPGPDFVRNYYWGPMIAGVEKAALKCDYDILLITGGGEFMDKTRNYLLQNRIDIAIALGSPKYLAGRRFPVPPVLVGSRADTEKIPCVYTSVQAAVEQSVAAMKRLGVNRAVWIGPEMTSERSSQSRDRLRWFDHYCREAGLPMEKWELKNLSLPPNQYRIESEISYWASQIRELRTQPEKNMGFLCWNDLIALGLYRELDIRELVPGKEVAVVGFDNHFAGAAWPSLASIGFNAEKLGEAAVEIALEILDQRKKGKQVDAAKTVEVPARLLMRSSLGEEAETI